MEEMKAEIVKHYVKGARRVNVSCGSSHYAVYQEIGGIRYKWESSFFSASFFNATKWQATAEEIALVAEESAALHNAVTSPEFIAAIEEVFPELAGQLTVAD